MSDQIKMVSKVSALFDIMCKGDKQNPKDREAVIERRARFYKTVPGLIWPEDWDSLDIEEKERRINALDKFGLEIDDE